MDMTVEVISGIAGMALSLVFSYVPGAATWYNALDGTKKRLLMLGFLLAVVLGIFGVSCLQGNACDTQYAMKLGGMFLSALVANQITDRVSPKVGEKAE